jgi:hypothetical protein
MRWLAVLVLAIIPAAVHADKVFRKSDNVIWDCAKDDVVRIKQSKGAFGFIGECKQITVNGGKNVLSIASVGKLVVDGKQNLAEIEKVESIAVSGAKNQVTWKKALKGDKPKVSTDGRGNQVEKKK